MKNILRRIKQNNGLAKLLLIVVVLCFIIATTFAWFTTSDSKGNVFKTGNYLFDVELEEDFSARTDTPLNVEIEKKVFATNTGNRDALVRLMVFPAATRDGEPFEVNIDEQVSLIGLNNEQWVSGGDGYYYYLHKLPPEKSTPKLFEKVELTIPDEKKDIYKNVKFDIVVKTEAINVHKNDYRLSWWGSVESQTTEPLKSIDEKLQDVLAE